MYHYADVPELYVHLEGAAAVLLPLLLLLLLLLLPDTKVEHSS